MPAITWSDSDWQAGAGSPADFEAEIEFFVSAPLLRGWPKAGLSQEDFAKKSGVKYTTLTKIESNVIKKPSVIVIAKIAKALGVSMENLLK